MADILITVTEETAAGGYASAAAASAAEAESAKLAAQQAKTGAEEAENAAEEAQTAADQAKIAAEEAAATATTEAGKATTAAGQAEAAKNTAVAAQIAASASSDDAQTAQEAAEAAATTAGAENAAAQTAAGFAIAAKNTAVEAAEAASISANTAEGHKTAAANSETAAAGSANLATTKANLATSKAAEAAASAADAANSASSANSNAQAATTKAAEASFSAGAAAASELAAQQAQTAAETAKALAESAKGAAQTAQAGAEQAESGAQTAQAAAELAKTGAEAAANTVAQSVEQIAVNTQSIASLENVINSANINQETTATATGVDVVALPKTAANTGMQVQMFGQSAQNLVVNGDFRNGTTGWTAIDSTILAANNVLSVTGTGIAIAPTAIQNTSTPAINGNKIYVKYKVRTTTADIIAFKFYLRGTVSGGLFDIARLTGIVINTQYQISAITTLSGLSGNLRIGIQSEYATTATASGKVMEVKEVILVDLTATFGAGNEPTKEQCDILFANYFEGSDNVLGTGRVRSVGKNLFDKYNYFDGETILVSNGASATNANYFRTNYIAVKPNTQYIQNYGTTGSGANGIAFYDANKVLISTSILSGVKPTFTTPSGTRYIRTSVLKSQGTADLFQIEQASTATTYEPYRQSILQLTTPELRSNGLIKDEIRKGTNGYGLVKRVGVGTLGANGITGGDFEGGLIGTKSDSDGVISTWTLNTTSPISGTQDGRLVIGTAGTSSIRPILSINISRTSGQFRRITFDYKVNLGTCILTSFFNGASTVTVNATLTGSGKYQIYYLCAGTAILGLYFNGTNLFDIQLDNIKDELVNTPDGIATGSTATVIGNNIHYTLATPTISPIAHAGLLNSNSNGTAYFEPIIADAGVYASNLAIQLTDYPIASFESIRKYANGTYTELSAATAVIASGGLSFTHPDLVSGDLVMFTYAYNRESIGRSMTLTHYDSRYVEADTANGKVYRWGVTITNGVPTLTVQEV